MRAAAQPSGCWSCETSKNGCKIGCKNGCKNSCKNSCKHRCETAPSDPHAHAGGRQVRQ
jgi:hypothetical protein